MRDNEDSSPDIIESRYRAKRGQDTLNIELGLSSRQSYSSDAGSSGSNSTSAGGSGAGSIIGDITTGGGGDSDGRSCVQIGTPVSFSPDSTVTEVLIDHEEWIAVSVAGDEPVLMDPDTLVAVWVRAKNLTEGDLADTGDNGEFAPIENAERVLKKSMKVKRTVEPTHQYRARRLRVHNLKPVVEDGQII